MIDKLDSADAGSEMEIHRPKAWHGLREFLKEYGIIVLGVLTAIGLEQTVEMFHWREVVALERKGLDREVADHWGSMQTLKDQQPCIDSRLTELVQLFQRHDAGQGLGKLGPVGRPLYGSVDRSAWDMALADQSLAHMDPGLRQKYADVQSSYGIFVTSTAEERTAWLDLQSLNHVASFSTADWSEARKAYDRAVDINLILKRGLDAKSEWMDAFKGFVLPKDVVSLRGMGMLKDLCTPMLTP